MKLRYDEQVDILYIKLKEAPYCESDEIREGLDRVCRCAKDWRQGG